MIEQINEYAQDMIPEDNPDATDADISDGNGNFATGWCWLSSLKKLFVFIYSNFSKLTL